jgi:hypothetical protein
MKQPESLDEYRLSVLLQQAKADGIKVTPVEWGGHLYELQEDDPMEEFDGNH